MLGLIHKFHAYTHTAAPGLPQFDEVAMAQLEAMGFPMIRCQKALLATGNNNAEAAMEWLFAHMEDPGRLLSHTIRHHGIFAYKEAHSMIELNCCRYRCAYTTSGIWF